MFTPKRMPKEGRSQPGLPYGGPSVRPRLGQRQIVLIVLALVCLPLLYYVTQSDTAVGPVTPGGANSKSQNPYKSTGAQSSLIDEDGVMKVDIDDYSKDDGVQPEIIKDDSTPPASKNSASSYTDADETDEKPHSKVASDDEDDSVVEESASSSQDTLMKQKHPSMNEKWATRPNFEKALDRIVTLLPDEVIMRELTREVAVTGKDRLREMGLRTRSYKKYFDAWEDLHLVEDSEGSVYIRDDVVQYLRAHQHKVDSSSSSSSIGMADMTTAQIIRAYESYRAFIQKFANLLFPWTMPYFPDHMSLHAHFKKGGRGIVLTAGDDQAPYLLTTIYSFRKLGCTLPIEVMYLGDQDLGEDYRTELEALPGVVTRDIAQMVNDEGWKLAGWAAKPFALLLCSFREVIFIDADSLFFRDPESLFDEPGYAETGALFFKDRLIMPESKKRWLQQVLPKPIPRAAKQSRFWTGESGHQQESGVIVVDKWKHFMSLLLVTRMNGPDRDGNKEQGKVGVYDMVYGDKETFWVGWLLAGDENYHFHDSDAGIMGLVKDANDKTKKPKPFTVGNDIDVADDPNLKGTSNYTICAPQLLHLDTKGKPYWFNGWLLDNKFAPRTERKFAHFKSYLVEPRELREPGAWQLAESNMCCLTSDKDKRHDFNEEEMSILKMIMQRARDTKAYTGR